MANFVKVEKQIINLDLIISAYRRSDGDVLVTFPGINSRYDADKDRYYSVMNEITFTGTGARQIWSALNKLCSPQNNG